MKPIVYAIVLLSAGLMSCSRVNFSTRQVPSDPTVTTLGTTSTSSSSTTSSTSSSTTSSSTTSSSTTSTTKPPTTTSSSTTTTKPPTTTSSTTTRPPTTTTVATVTRTKTITVDASMTSVDILLVIDDSSSMAQDNAKLAQRLSGLVTGLQSSNLDWQMCVTTTDTGYYGGRPIVWSGNGGNHILKPSIGSNLSSVIQQTVYDIGSGYSNDEQGIYAANLSVQGNGTTGCYRSQAALAVVLISDEDERSVGGVYNRSSAQYKALHSGNYPQNYVNLVKSTFGANKKLAFNSVIVQDSGCEATQDAQGTPSFQGTFYLNAASLTAGRTGSICDSDYYQHMNLFKVNIQNTVSSVTLDCVPYGAVTVAPSYPHTIDSNKIIFNPALTDGSSVTITYRCQL